MRILCVDPGSKRLGIAVSDPTGTIAGPLTMIEHISRAIDAATIAHLAGEQGAAMIIVGQSLDEENRPTIEGRRAGRLASAIRNQTNLPVVLWDESHSTQSARVASIAMGISGEKRRRQGHGHLDALAATVILQSYLDSRATEGL